MILSKTVEGYTQLSVDA